MCGGGGPGCPGGILLLLVVMVGGAVEAVVVVVDDAAIVSVSDEGFSSGWDVGTLALVVSGFSLLLSPPPPVEVTTPTACFSSGVGLVVEVGSSGFTSELLGGSLELGVSLTLG